MWRMGKDTHKQKKLLSYIFMSPDEFLIESPNFLTKGGISSLKKIIFSLQLP